MGKGVRMERKKDGEGVVREDGDWDGDDRKEMVRVIEMERVW